MFLFLLTSRVLMIYCCSIVIVTAYTLLLVCVYSPLHCTLLPTRGDSLYRGPGPPLPGTRPTAGLCRVRALSGAGPCSAHQPRPVSEARVRSAGPQPRLVCSVSPAQTSQTRPRPAKQPSRPTSIFSNHSFHFLSLGSLSSNNTSMIWGSKSMTHS